MYLVGTFDLILLLANQGSRGEKLTVRSVSIWFSSSAGLGKE